MITNVPIDPKNIQEIECKYANYQAAVDGSMDDMLLVKEVVHTKDDKLIPRIVVRENVKRPVYITKENYRNHQDKKEHEDIDKLNKIECTQNEMAVAIQRALGYRHPNPKAQLREVCRSPYVYLADLTLPTYVKATYKNKWKDFITRNNVAILDIETDVVHGTGKPITISVTMRDIKIVGAVQWFADMIPGGIEDIKRVYEEQMSAVPILNKKKKEVEIRNLVEERGSNIEYITDKDMGVVIQKVMARTHEIMPDFLAIWNMDFDMPKIIAQLRESGIPLEEVFCDPIVPDKYRKVHYKQASAQRVTNSKTISQHPADLWHVLFCQAGFYVIDAMCLFKKIRVASGNEPSYKLDFILKKHLGVGKLKFDLVDDKDPLKWHIEMQSKYPAEYIVYNIFDCVSIELLDERTNDLGLTASSLCDISEYHIFPSLPKRLVDILTYFYLENGKVPGCVGADITSTLDENIIGLDGWIVTLPAHMVEENGLNCIEEFPELKTNFRVQTADDDIAQAYPTGEVILNISKETTHVEICEIHGIPEANRRRAGINLTSGQVNAIEVGNELFGLPYIHTVLDEFEADIEKGLVA